MLRATVRILGARPKGPLGQRVGGSYELSMPYRSEKAQLNESTSMKLNSNIRATFKVNKHAKIFAPPRDVGEIPRNYVAKILFAHQPVKLLDLWEICKQNDDVPLDSMKHLRFVLKIAKVHKWVYCEKNQTNNQWYYYIHQSRSSEVQEMIRSAAVAEKDAELQKSEDSQAAKEAEEVLRAEELDNTISALQNQLVANVSKISEFDPAFVRNLPYYTESGAVNVAWHYTRQRVQLAADEQQ